MTRNILRRIRNSPEVPSPASTSRALDVFDPHITRRLHNFIPIRIVQLPSQTKAWDAIDSLLQGWENLDHLLSCHSLFAWDVSRLRLHLLWMRLIDDAGYWSNPNDIP